MKPPASKDDAASPNPWIPYVAGLFIGFYAYLAGLYLLLFAFQPG